MNRLQASFHELVRGNRRGLLPYITAGFPDTQTTLDILKALDPAICPCAELGIPFSDPIADGPVIQASFSEALKGGFRLTPFLAALAACRAEIRVPLIMMISYSIVYRRGVAEFPAEMVAAGIDGLLLPDLPLEESPEVAAACRASGVPIIRMIAPTTLPDRRERLAEVSSPFIYYQSTVGVTGERGALPSELKTDVRALRQQSGKPVCVGFGVSSPQQVAAICEFADGAIVGSAIIRRMLAAFEQKHAGPQIARAAVSFIDELAAPLRGGGTCV